MIKNIFLQFTRLCNVNRGVAIGEGMRRARRRARRTMAPPTSISKPNKVEEVRFQTSGILLFRGIQKLYGPEISRLLLYATIFGQLTHVF